VDSAGQVFEEWRGLRLQRVRDRNAAKVLAVPLLGPWLERRTREMISEWNAAIAVELSDQHNGRGQSDRALSRAMGVDGRIVRAGGKPEGSINGWHLSATHSGDLLVAVAGPPLVACDAEEVVARSRDLWRDLLGFDRFALAELIATQLALRLDLAATYVWAAGECITKAGGTPQVPLLFERSGENAVLFSSGPGRIATMEVSSGETSRVFAFLHANGHSECAITNIATS
jgi:enediyne polyketide synthase